GILYRHVIGSYSHGPLLSKNPEIADTLLSWALERRQQRTGEQAPKLSALDDTAELNANAYMLKRRNVSSQAKTD
ncbi:MAG: hypothetical protein LUB61_04215, partial [Eggerthellaceae bacterium]|nr:hypothetical protein [Eggerthellaceae bacterium]